MSRFGKPRETVLAKLWRWGFHFFIGVLFGILPAIFTLSAITVAPSLDVYCVEALVFAIFCVPCGVFFWMLGLIGQGRLLYGLLRLFGKELDSNAL